jgi:hypothetical protein
MQPQPTHVPPRRIERRRDWNQPKPPLRKQGERVCPELCVSGVA